MNQSPQFLRYRQPLVIQPRPSSRQRRELAQRPAVTHKWRSALVIALIAIGIMAGLYLAWDCALSALEWVHR